ncbi:MEGF6 protein, partial [Nicator chloris]|nr:MEGF6 protein [Nicator chloris]
CHPVTGDCVCPPGRAGPTCERGKCGPHRYGLGCQQRCSCRNGGLCDPADGSCSCAPGWTGKSCE